MALVPDYTSPFVVANLKTANPWADPMDAAAIAHLFNATDGKLNRVSFSGHYELEDSTRRPIVRQILLSCRVIFLRSPFLSLCLLSSHGHSKHCFYRALTPLQNPNGRTGMRGRGLLGRWGWVYFDCVCQRFCAHATLALHTLVPSLTVFVSSLS